MLKIGTVVKFIVPDDMYQWYTDWYGDMVRAGEHGKIVECLEGRYRVAPLSKDSKSRFSEFTTDASTVEAINIYKKF